MQTERISSENILKGKVAVVTGAGRGLDGDLILARSKTGSNIGLVARIRQEIEEAAREIKAAGKKVLLIRVGLTRSDDISKMVEKVNLKLKAYLEHLFPLDRILETDDLIGAVFFSIGCLGNDHRP
jgi:NAD(P)-dependent dehydrogenase (short-subunit alcohol dehydrogenase family)